jgi:competence protein ComEA
METIDMRHLVLATLALAAITGASSTPAIARQEGKAPAKSSKPAASTQVVNVNTASAADFEALPGIGPKLAARIVDYRQKNGPFKKIEELMNVQGLGEKNFLKLKPQLTLGSTKTPAPQEPRED